MYFLGVDAGTTSIKSMLLDVKGNEIASAAKEYTLLTPRTNFVELEVEEYWAACKNSIGRVIHKSGIKGEDIASLAISSQGETLIAVDKDGKPLSRAIVWADNRSVEECRILKEKLSEEAVYKVTGQPKIIPTWPATKILWIRRHKPELFKKVYKFLLVEDYLTFKLSGIFATEPSVNSSSLLLDIDKGLWWNEILDEVGITQDQLATLYPSGTPIGNVQKVVASETGLGANTIVVTGAFDQAASAIGAGNIKPGIVSETTGAAMGIVATIEHPVFDPKKRVPCQRHAADNLYFLMPFTQTAGMVLRWYRDMFGSMERQVGDWTSIDAYDLLGMEAAQIPAGSEGLVILPHLAGAACPEYDPNARGVIFGLTLSHSRGHVVRAIMEAVAYMLRKNINTLEEIGAEVQKVLCLGGAARSLLWTQIKADVLQRRVVVPKMKEASCLGAAMLAALASKTFSSLDDVARAWVSVENIIEPNRANKDVYNNLYCVYVKLYDSLKPLFPFVSKF